jgi:hypothetical protein
VGQWRYCGSIRSPFSSPVAARLCYVEKRALNALIAIDRYHNAAEKTLLGAAQHQGTRARDRCAPLWSRNSSRRERLAGRGFTVVRDNAEPALERICFLRQTRNRHGCSILERWIRRLAALAKCERFSSASCADFWRGASRRLSRSRGSAFALGPSGMETAKILRLLAPFQRNLLKVLSGGCEDRLSTTIGLPPKNSRIYILGI